MELMPKYRVGDQTVRRKNFYMPCVIAADVAGMSDEERAKVLKATYWADNITNAEWPVVLRHEGVKAYVRSKFKRKVVGWLMALGRIAKLNPAFFEECAIAARALYEEQVRQEYPDVRFAPLFGLELVQPGESLVLSIVDSDDV
jgi:hypothetical protein